MAYLALDVAQWAEENFGTCELGDARRTRRAVKLAQQMAEHPDGSTPDQTERWADLKAAYRLAHCDDVTFAAVVVLLSPGGVLRQGRNTFTIEFRSADSGTLVDAGSVRASANMAMPGMVMSSGMQAQPTGTPGRYTGSADFGMAGAWQMTIDWDGAAGSGSVSFEGAVQ